MEIRCIRILKQWNGICSYRSSYRPDSSFVFLLLRVHDAIVLFRGCCHDYQNQKRIISEGLPKRVGLID